LVGEENDLLAEFGLALFVVGDDGGRGLLRELGFLSFASSLANSVWAASRFFASAPRSLFRSTPSRTTNTSPTAVALTTAPDGAARSGPAWNSERRASR
jgi:hypothetical protein